MNKIVILAAGKGKRMEHELPKVLVPIKGKPMLEYLIESVVESGVDKNPVIVVSPENKELIKKSLKKYNCQYAIQDRQLGTGHALSCAKDKIDKTIKNIIVFYGDSPLIKSDTIKKLGNLSKSVITIATTEVENFNDWQKNFYNWGRVIRSKDEINKIVEFKDASNEEKEIKEVNSGIYCFQKDWLFENIKKLKNNNAQKEYYLTDLIKIAFEQNININAIKINPREVIGINSKEELEVAEKLIN